MYNGLHYVDPSGYGFFRWVARIVGAVIGAVVGFAVGGPEGAVTGAVWGFAIGDSVGAAIEHRNEEKRSPPTFLPPPVPPSTPQSIGRSPPDSLVPSPTMTSPVGSFAPFSEADIVASDVPLEQSWGPDDAIFMLIGMGVAAKAAVVAARELGPTVLFSLRSLGETGAIRLGAGAPAMLEAGGQAASHSLQKIAVIGTRADTLVAKSWPGHIVLDVPGWSLAVNKSWVRWIIKNRLPVYLASPMNYSTLWDPKRLALRVFAREIRQLLNAGYRKVGQYLLPP